VVYNFTSEFGPIASVVIGKGEVLYGTTNAGATAGYGTVFVLKPFNDTA
jgi:hypothetical protein